MTCYLITLVMEDTNHNQQNSIAGLQSVVLFLNTIDLTSAADSIATRPGLARWLSEGSFLRPEEDVSIDDVSRAVAFRDALRAVVTVNTGDSASGSAVETVNRAARLAGLQFRLSTSGSTAVLESSSGGGLDAAIASMLSAIYTAMADGSWRRIKTCRNPACRWAFYDRSRNRSGVWCEMAACGNRLKARRYRLRRAQRVAADPGATT